ncbi:MAG: tetratricopeptide repeat protein [Verrucomicrobia bacterium]|nr:tetratricopeptide repeat protein [Verrucomicrobiota bacterium]
MNETADDHMRAGRYGDALLAYQAAWSERQDELDETQQIWLLLSIAKAAVRLGDFEEAFETLVVLPEHYADSGIVVGNPLFHLLVGLSYHGLKEDPDGATDNFARALICGGPELFSGEDPAHLRRMKEILRPPAELGTWTGYEGCSRDLLNQATGYLREWITERIGSPPPFAPPGDK